MYVFLIIFLVLYFSSGRKNPNAFRKLEGKLGKIIGSLIVISIISLFIPGMLWLGASILYIIFSVLPILVLILLIKKIFFPGKNKKGRKKGIIVEDEERLSTTLTKSVPKRRKIVHKFNKKYDLGLEEEEINRIVDASYMSFAWEREIHDMSKNYDSVYEWYNGITNWLRVYLKALPIEHVSSDFNRQKQICLETFKQIMDEVNPSGFSSLDDCISYMNNRYFSTFDENTFMIMYKISGES